MSVIEKKYTRRLNVSYSKEFNTDSSTLWALVSAPNNLNDCHPFCQSNKVVQWGGGEYSDILVYLNGRTYLRRFQSWSEGSGYSLLIGEEDGPQSYVVWRIDSLGASQSRLTITVYPFILAKLPKLLAYLPHVLWVRPRLRSYLNSVLSGFQYNVESKEPIPRNHFGKHPWFS